MLVEQMLSRARQGLAVIEVEAPVMEAAALMSKPHTNLVVVCDQGDMVGVLTKPDIVGQIWPLHGFGLHGKGGRHHDARCHLLPDTRNAARCLVGDGKTRSAACSAPRQGTQATRYHVCAGRSTGPPG